MSLNKIKKIKLTLFLSVTSLIMITLVLLSVFNKTKYNEYKIVCTKETTIELDPRTKIFKHGREIGELWQVNRKSSEVDTLIIRILRSVPMRINSYFSVEENNDLNETVLSLHELHLNARIVPEGSLFFCQDMSHTFHKRWVDDQFLQLYLNMKRLDKTNDSIADNLKEIDSIGGY